MKDYYDTGIDKSDCEGIPGGTWNQAISADCVFNSKSWTPLEDPCGLPYSSNCIEITDRGMCNGSTFCKYNETTKKCTKSEFKNMSEQNKKMFRVPGSSNLIKYKIRSGRPACIGHECTDVDIQGSKPSAIVPNSIELDIPDLAKTDIQKALRTLKVEGHKIKASMAKTSSDVFHKTQEIKKKLDKIRIKK